MPITEAILATAAAHPSRLAIAADGVSLSYEALVASSRRTIAAVEALHDGQQQPPVPAPEMAGVPATAVSLTSAFEAARIVVSLAGYRAVSAVIDPRWPLGHQVRVIETTGIGVVISDSAELSEHLERRGWGGTVITSEQFRRAEADADPAPAPAVRDAAEPFLLLFSSGTTSDPKAFLKTRQQYRANVAVSSANLEPLPGVATLAPGPLSYSLTLYAVIECMATGGSAYLADSFDALAAGKSIERHGITRVVAVPAIIKALAAAATRDPERFASVTVLVAGGANLPESIRASATASMPRAKLISYYGAAEIGFIGDSRDADGQLVRIYDGVRVEVRDDAGDRLADGALGTLWVLAEATSDGYLAGTSTARLRDAHGWATVHDQARMHGKAIELVGRAGDIAITGGHKVALTEVEQAFVDAPWVEAVCAVALPDASLGSVVALAFEGTAAKSQLQAWAADRLAPQFIPHRWYRVDRLPRTVGGKVRRHETAELVASGGAERL